MNGRVLLMLAGLAVALAALPAAKGARAADGLGLAQVVCLAQAGPWDEEDEDSGSTRNCTPGKALLGASAVAVSGDGRNVYAAAWGASSLVSYARSGPLGQLRQIGCVTSNGTNGIDGTKRQCADGDALGGAARIALSPDGRNLYVASVWSSGIAIFTRDPATGKVVQTGCVKGISTCVGARGLGGASDLVVSPDGRNVYLASAWADAIVMFSRDPETGALRGLGCISDDGTDRQCASGNALRGASAIAMSRDGRSLYVSASDSNAVLTFDRSPDTGLLTQRGCAMERAPVPGSCTRARGIAYPGQLVIAPDDRTLFVTAGGSNGLAVFARDRNTGAITQRGCVTDPYDAETEVKDGCAHVGPMQSPSDIALSPDGRRVLVVGSSGLVAFQRDAATGGLVKAGCAVPRGEEEYLGKAAKDCTLADGLWGGSGIAVSPDARNVYLTASSSNSLSVLAPAASLRVLHGLFRGLLAVRVACPATVAAGCGGRLTLAGPSGRRAARPFPYALAPGTARTVLLRVRPGLRPARLVLRAVDRRRAVAPVARRILVGAATAPTRPPHR